MASQVRWGRTEDKKYNGPGIYMFISPSGKRYIGQSVNVHKRVISGHRDSVKRKKPNGSYKYTTHWARAARKYGWGKMKVFILQRFNPDESNLHDVLNKWEKYWIKWFKSDNRKYGYNANEGGGSWATSAETKAKLSLANKGEKNHNFGKKLSAATRAKMSATMKGEKHPNFGKKLSAETRAKMSAALKGKKRSAATRAKISAAQNKAVIAIFPTGEEKKFQSITDAAKKLSTDNIKFHISAISMCCRGKHKTHHKYKFKYA